MQHTYMQAAEGYQRAGQAILGFLLQGGIQVPGSYAKPAVMSHEGPDRY